MSIDEVIQIMEMDILEGKMNKPEPSSKYAYIESDKDNRKWITCPYCGKKNLLYSEGAVIIGQTFRCKGSNCKKIFDTNLV